jgi:hypothetical protein
MYNNQIAEVLKKTYGDEKFKIYCEMQILKSKLEDEQLRQTDKDSTDANYEAFFWELKMKEVQP